MKIFIPTNHNYYEEQPLTENQLKEQFGLRKSKQLQALKEKLFSSLFELTTQNASLEQIQIFGFRNSPRKFEEEEEQLILRLYKKENAKGESQYFIQTGLFAGVIYHKGIQFNITSRYGDFFLKRMLNFVNDIYVDNQQSQASKSKEVNEFQHIIAYLFIQSLEKAAVLGLPKLYQEQIQRSTKVRGKININTYLKKDFPFRGKLTSSYRSQVYVQEIVDVLFLAGRQLEKKFGKDINRKISGIFQLLKQHYSGCFPQSATIEKAKRHKVLQNPIYSSFRNTLTYAEIILKEQNLLGYQQNNQLVTQGYLFDIAQLFEVYLEKLFNRHFKEWYVIGQEAVTVYNKQFYRRKMFPDIVLRHKETQQIIVFDAKFKNMRLIKKDVDRADFYQIHSYIQYYQPTVLLGGLIYPLSKAHNPQKAYAKHLFGQPCNQTGFIVDGVYVNEAMKISEIINQEGAFLKRLDKLILDSL